MQRSPPPEDDWRARASKRAKFLNPRFSTLALAGTEGGIAALSDGQRPPAPESDPRTGSSTCIVDLLDGRFSSSDEARDIVFNSNDMLKILFGSLGMQDLCRVAMVSTQWLSISQLDDFWTDLSFENRNVKEDQMRSILARHSTVQSLNLTGHKFTDVNLFFAEAIGPLGSLRSLQLGGTSVSEQQLTTIATCLLSLRELRVTDASLGRFGAGEVVVSHDHLTVLVFNSCRVSRLAIRCPSLLNLSLRGSALSVLNPQCPELLQLDMKGCSKIGDSAVRLAVTRLPNLTSLDLSANLPLSDDTLREVALQCPNLTHLQLASCIAISLSGVFGLLGLRYLNLAHCDSLTNTSVRPIINCLPNLEEVILDGSGLITRVHLALPKLRILSLRGCRSLVKVSLACRRLEELKLGPIDRGARHSPGCGALKKIHLQSDAVQTICWRAFPLLETVSLRCPNLLQLDLSDCDSLKDRTVEALGWAFGKNSSGSSRAPPSPQASDDTDSGDAAAPDGAESSADVGSGLCCPQLHTLRLDSCLGLRDCRLSSPSLSNLSLAGCKTLHSLSLECPRLSQLSLAECDLIEDVVLAPVDVTDLCLGTCPSLVSLHVSASRLVTLDLKGCGLLEELKLQCPALGSLDATFCASLGNEALSQALVDAPPLEDLILGVCSSLGPSGLASLCALTGLRRLDLSYTEAEDLTTVIAHCPRLSDLSLASCSCLTPRALSDVLLTPSCHALTALDISYCPLPPESLALALAHGSGLKSLSLSGCQGATEALWAGLSPDPSAIPHALQSLSLVGCKQLRSCVLGLSETGSHFRQPATAPVCAATDMEVGRAWAEVPTQLQRLQSLKLGLSSIRVLALALPALTVLDANGCCELTELELRCPLLLQVCLQACRALPGHAVPLALKGCDQLEVLDVQHFSMSDDERSQLRRQCPSLRYLLHTSESNKGSALQLSFS